MDLVNGYPTPGVFSHGRLDAGTRALLEVMRRFPVAGRRVLDFACGSGVIGAFLSALEPTARVGLSRCRCGGPRSRP